MTLITFHIIDDVCNFNYGPGKAENVKKITSIVVLIHAIGHYMKPKRMHMVHNMVVNYGLYKKLDIVVRLSSIQ